MKKRWNHPTTITGDAATEDRYLRRDHINEYFWREVGKGNHLLFVAPRRVGKTSIMIDLAGNCPEGFVGIYQDIEGVKSKEEFYQRLFELILECVDRSKIAEAKAFIIDFFKKHGIKEISRSGLKWESRELNYEKELRDLIPELKRVKVHTVVFLDEFAEVIHKLSRKGKSEDAVEILHFLRELRNDGDFEHFTMVFGGSIGLEFVIRCIGRPKLINDLHRIAIGPLTSAEASQLVRKLTKRATIQLSNKMVEYLKERIEYLLPYYIQLMIEEIDLIACGNRQPTIVRKTIDLAFDRVLKKRSNFEDWLERLKDYQADLFPFINAILKHAAHHERITIQEIHDKAIDPKFNRSEDYMERVDQLLQEGYLVQSGEREYRFISPFLRQFWLKQYPIYNEYAI